MCAKMSQSCHCEGCKLSDLTSMQVIYILCLALQHSNEIAEAAHPSNASLIRLLEVAASIHRSGASHCRHSYYHALMTL